MATTTWIDADSVAAEESAATDGAATEQILDVRRHVLDRLTAEGWRFDFFQAVRLLEQVSEAPPGETSDLRAARLRLRPDPALSFPATDVRRIQSDDDGRVTMDLTFMGLYGVASPLPSFFSESVVAQSETPSPLSSFLDVFSHRIYALFYRAWKKCRPEFFRRESLRDRHSRRFLSLTGIGGLDTIEKDVVPPSLLLAYAGRFMPRARNAEGLSAVAAAAFAMPAEIVENVPRWVPMRERPRTGRGGGMTLGATATIGERLYDVMGKLRIRLGPMDADDYLSLLPGGAKAKTLQTLTRAYVPGYLDYDVELRLKPGCLRPSRLGDATSRLGYTACLGTPAESALTRIIRYEKTAA